MSIKISIKNNINPNSVKNYVFFTNKDFRINGYSKLPISKYSNFINKLLNSSELGNKNFKINELSKLPISKFSSFINQSLSSNQLVDKNFLSLDINASQKVILIKIKDSQSPLEIEKIGAEFYVYLKSNSYLKTIFYEQI